MTDQHRHAQHRLANGATASRPLWHTYLGITGLLLFIFVALAGGIIWYNSKKSNELAIAAADRLILAESFKDEQHLQAILDEAQLIVSNA